jgi:hypothetical protein
MSRRSILSLAIAALVFGAASARADNVTFSNFTDGSQTVNIALSAPNVPTVEFGSAGGFTASLNGGASFTTYCVDLYQYIWFGAAFGDYSVVNASAHAFANSNAAGDLGKLFSENNVVNNSVSQAAFQIAVWEIAYERSGSYNLANGSATFTGGSAASSGALSLATSWLNGLGGVTNTANLMVLESPGHQDQVFATPVPEPSTYALMAAGLLGMGFVARRRIPRQR